MIATSKATHSSAVEYISHMNVQYKLLQSPRELQQLWLTILWSYKHGFGHVRVFVTQIWLYYYVMLYILKIIAWTFRQILCTFIHGVPIIDIV